MQARHDQDRVGAGLGARKFIGFIPEQFHVVQPLFVNVNLRLVKHGLTDVHSNHLAAGSNDPRELGQAGPASGSQIDQFVPRLNVQFRGQIRQLQGLKPLRIVEFIGVVGIKLMMSVTLPGPVVGDFLGPLPIGFVRIGHETPSRP